MKKLVFILILFGLSAFASAQSRTEARENLEPGLRYEYLKKIYKTKDYSKYSDIYGESLFSVGLTSLLVPGFGDVIVDEGLRGFIKFGTACALVGTDLILNGYNKEYSMYLEIGIIGYWIWNVVDSIKVAMIKNMYFSDLYKEYGIILNISPTVSPIITPSGIMPSAGMSLSVSF